MLTSKPYCIWHPLAEEIVKILGSYKKIEAAVLVNSFTPTALPLVGGSHREGGKFG